MQLQSLCCAVLLLQLLPPLALIVVFCHRWLIVAVDISAGSIMQFLP